MTWHLNISKKACKLGSKQNCENYKNNALDFLVYMTI